MDAYVDDAFGACHRAHASIVGPPATLPSAAGRLLAKEVEVLLGLRDHPKRPFVAVLGGAKVSDKLGVIDALLGVVDSLVIGGGMCFTFLGAQGFPVGDSLFEPDQVETCRRLLEAGKPIHLPDDIVGLAADGSVQTFGRRLPDGAKGLDIGPGTAARFADIVTEVEQRLLERPHGHVRGRALRLRHPGGRAGGGRHPRLHRRGRRRLRRRPRRVRSGRRRRLGDHRRGSLARAARAGRPARPRSPPHAKRLGRRCRPSASGNCQARAAKSGRYGREQRPESPSSPATGRCTSTTSRRSRRCRSWPTWSAPDDVERVDVSIHPPFTDIRSVQTLIESDRIPFAVGAQHCHWEDKGAFTGEVAPPFLAKLGVTLVIAGHSERRELFGETDEMVNKKVKAILANAMTPILCVGETLEEREAGATEAKVLGQLEADLAGVSNEQVGAMVIAYEPIWAIGTGRTATAEDAQAMCGAIRAAVGAAVRRRRRRDRAGAVRRVGQGVEHRRADGPARHRRGPGRGGQPRPGRVRPHRPVPPERVSGGADARNAAHQAAMDL